MVLFHDTILRVCEQRISKPFEKVIFSWMFSSIPSANTNSFQKPPPPPESTEEVEGRFQLLPAKQQIAIS